MRRDFQGRGNVEAFSGTRVEAMDDGVQLTLRVPQPVRPLGHGLAHQPVRVFMGAARPGALRIGKEDLDGEPLGQALVLGPLVAPIIRQGFAQQCGDVPEFFRETRTGTPCIRPVHPSQEHQAGGALHQGADRRALARALDQVAFPVAGHRPGRDLGRTLRDRRHTGNLAAAGCSSRPRPTRLARLTQRRQQFTAQGAARQHRQAHIDGFGREVFPPVVRIRALEPSGNLFGRVALRLMLPHVRPQPGIQECAGSPGLTGSGGCLCLRRTGAIGVTSRAVAGRLATHGAGGAPQHSRHRPERMAMGQTQAQRLTVFRIHVSRGSLGPGNTVAHQGR